MKKTSGKNFVRIAAITLLGTLLITGCSNTDQIPVPAPPEEPDYGITDKLISVASATGTSEETGSTPRLFTHSYDGDFVSHFNSKFGEITTWPFSLEYTLKTPNKLDYIVYYPRSDGNQWGSFNRFDVYITTGSNPQKVKIASMERGNGIHTPCRITLDEPVENVRTVFFEIHSAYQNRVSCAEMEFHEIIGTRFDYTTVFADDLCTALKPGVTAEDIEKLPNAAYRTLADRMMAGTYDADYRVAEFRPYQHPSIMAASNRLYYAYSVRDNPTGIYVDAGDDFYVLVGDTKGQELSLVIQNLDLGWSQSRTLPLGKGENRLKAPISGLLYVMNHTNDPVPLVLETDEDKAAADAKTVKMHFMNARVQGYYRRGVTTAADWAATLSSAQYREIDVVGDYAHLTWIAADLRNASADIASIIEKLDRLTWLEQELCGLVKYDKMFRNRMYCHIINSGNPNATMYKTAYTPGYGEIFTTPARFETRIWVLGHEVGHINQIHGLKWAGTTEVTNNIYSMYVQQQMTTETPRLLNPYSSSETVWNGVTYPDVYETAIAAIVDSGNPHCLENKSNEFFLKLVPFWQLQLYISDALGNKDFYPDIYEYYRTSEPDAGTLSNGGQQLLFVETACRAAGLDLTAFFEKWGFLTPVSRTVEDYGSKQIEITAGQVAATRARIAAAGYPAPPHTAERIIAIRDTNVADYKK